MAIVIKKQAAIPDGDHRGIIIEAAETQTDFGKGPEPTVRLVIQPEWRQDEKTETLPIAVNFSPVINGISGFSKLLSRLAVPVADSGEFDTRVLEGLEIQFRAARNDRGFVNVDKESIRRANPKTARK